MIVIVNIRKAGSSPMRGELIQDSNSSKSPFGIIEQKSSTNLQHCRDSSVLVPDSPVLVPDSPVLVPDSPIVASVRRIVSFSSNTIEQKPATDLRRCSGNNGDPQKCDVGCQGISRLDRRNRQRLPTMEKENEGLF